MAPLTLTLTGDGDGDVVGFPSASAGLLVAELTMARRSQLRDLVSVSDGHRG
jgi:hypothetical protein